MWYNETCARVAKALDAMGYTYGETDDERHHTCLRLWSHYSESHLAGWMGHEGMSDMQIVDALRLYFVQEDVVAWLSIHSVNDAEIPELWRLFNTANGLVLFDAEHKIENIKRLRDLYKGRRINLGLKLAKDVIEACMANIN